MGELLREWKLPQFIQNNEVTTEILAKLIERMIKELIPNIGTRTNNVENIDISFSGIIPEEKRSPIRII
ncbi:hypothetical protein JTB14_027941 [Gonioctena quinquepunctata]|nr:hypothetical protein JTB14_027941 [Gonioctena quinquepunctata]